MADNASLYLAAVIGWFTGKVPTWWLSITLSVGSGIKAPEDTLSHRVKTEIFNTDPRSQVTSVDLT